MTLPLTPTILRAAYDFLNETPPFNKWNLPDGEDVKFEVLRSRSAQGWHSMTRGKHTIQISAGAIGFTRSLVEVMAHEMVHVHERHSGTCRAGTEHSAAFNKWAAQVCKIHGFDPKTF